LNFISFKAHKVRTLQLFDTIWCFYSVC